MIEQVGVGNERSFGGCMIRSSYVDASGTNRFSVVRRVRNDGRHVMNGCLVAELGDDRVAGGEASTVVDCDRRCD